MQKMQKNAKKKCRRPICKKICKICKKICQICSLCKSFSNMQKLCKLCTGDFADAIGPACLHCRASEPHHCQVRRRTVASNLTLARDWVQVAATVTESDPGCFLFGLRLTASGAGPSRCQWLQDSRAWEVRSKMCNISNAPLWQLRNWPHQRNPRNAMQCNEHVKVVTIFITRSYIQLHALHTITWKRLPYM